MEKVNILGVNVDNITMKDAVDKTMKFFEEDKLNPIYTPNPEFIMSAQEDEEFKKILNEGALVIPDGIGVIYASRIIKNPLPERVPGYDLIENVFGKMKDTEYKAYFLGSKGDVSKIAAEKMMEKYKGLKVVGYRDGYFKIEDEDKIVEDINNSGADLLLVGTGAPRQEKFIYRNKERLKAKVAVGCGGSLDGFAGIVKRAPVAFQKMGLEWFYRLLCQPSRVGRMMKLPQFLWIVMTKKNTKF